MGSRITAAICRGSSASIASMLPRGTKRVRCARFSGKASRIFGIPVTLRAPIVRP